MIKQLDGDMKPNRYTNDISILRDKLINGFTTADGTTVQGIKNLDNAGKIALKALEHPLATGDATVAVVEGLTALKIEPNAPVIKEYLDWMDKVAIDAKVALSPAEKAGILLDSIQGNKLYTLEDIGKNTDVISSKVVATIKDFGHAQGNVKELSDARNAITELVRLTGNYDTASKDLNAAKAFALRNPASQETLPAKFTALEKASNAIGKKFEVKPQDLITSAKPKPKGTDPIQPEKPSGPTLEEIERAIQSPAPTEAPKSQEQILKEDSLTAKLADLTKKTDILRKNPKIKIEGSPEQKVYDRLMRQKDSTQLRLGSSRLVGEIKRWFTRPEDKSIDDARQAKVLTELGQQDVPLTQAQNNYLNQLKKENSGAPPAFFEAVRTRLQKDTVSPSPENEQFKALISNRITDNSGPARQRSFEKFKMNFPGRPPEFYEKARRRFFDE